MKRSPTGGGKAPVRIYSHLGGYYVVRYEQTVSKIMATTAWAATLEEAEKRKIEMEEPTWTPEQ